MQCKANIAWGFDSQTLRNVAALNKRLDLPGPVGWMEEVEPLRDIPQLRHRRRPQRRHAGFSRTNLLSFKLLRKSAPKLPVLLMHWNNAYKRVNQI